MTHPKKELGTLNRLKILCISETGWFDSKTLLGDVKEAGGVNANQYDMTWPPFGHLHAENAAGSSALLEAEESDGTVHKFLFDTGWGNTWMEKRFAEEHIDQMLQNNEIEALIISHEHFDHFWGLSTTLKYCPQLTIYVPSGFHEDGFKFIAESGHTGKVVTVSADNPLQLFSGMVLVNFKMDTLFQVSGENVLYFNLAEKGTVLVTGCGHTGIINLLDYVRQTFMDGQKIYAVYGGLHISPLEEWDEDREQLIQSLKQYDMAHLGCNHCTGLKAVQRMIEIGLPVVRGSGQHGSQTDLFLGNGDVLELGNIKKLTTAT